MERPGLYLMVFLILLHTCSQPSTNDVRRICDKPRADAPVSESKVRDDAVQIGGEAP